MTEQQLQDAIVELARYLGYRVAHFAPARTEKGWRTACRYDAAGFPDLVLLGRGRVIFAEIKADKGKLSPDQEKWQSALAAIDSSQPVGGDTAQFGPVRSYVWKPRTWHDGVVELDLKQ